MESEWVLERLAELRRFARDAGMVEFEARLAEAAQVAILELTDREPVPARRYPLV